jgi:hypothetical protein
MPSICTHHRIKCTRGMGEGQGGSTGEGKIGSGLAGEGQTEGGGQCRHASMRTAVGYPPLNGIMQRAASGVANIPRAKTIFCAHGKKICVCCSFGRLLKLHFYTPASKLAIF